MERELKATYKDRWIETARPSFPDWQQTGKDGRRTELGYSGHRSGDVRPVERLLQEDPRPFGSKLAFELRDVRNKWAHQKAFSTDDAYRAIDSVSRLLAAVAARSRAKPSIR